MKAKTRLLNGRDALPNGAPLVNIMRRLFDVGHVNGLNDGQMVTMALVGDVAVMAYRQGRMDYVAGKTIPALAGEPTPKPLRTKRRMPEDDHEEGEEPAPVTNGQVGGLHYQQFAIQPFEIAERNKLTFLEGSAVKRIHRHSRGGKGVEDLRKAVHELRLLALHVYNEEL